MDMSANLRSVEIDHSGSIVSIVQITDCHLGDTPGTALLGMDTDHSLQCVVNLVQNERDQIDLLLATGDLSDQGANAAYRRLKNYFGQLTQHSFWLPGNHDAREELAAVCEGTHHFSNEILIAGWQIVMLDSQIPGEVGGELGAGQLALLKQCLARAQDNGLHTLICMHHQPVTVGSAWIDQQMVADADAFFDLIGQHACVKGILWGHVHQQIDSQWQGIPLLATPSSCVQFAPGVTEFKVDDLPPGYRWLDLHADGTIETGVSRVRGVAFSVELDSGGYL
jgi:Icc protein